jgi:hypothetical protein
VIGGTFMPGPRIGSPADTTRKGKKRARARRDSGSRRPARSRANLRNVRDLTSIVYDFDAIRPRMPSAALAEATAPTALAALVPEERGRLLACAR